MDIFRFVNPTAPTKMEEGEILNGIKRKLWIERYRTAGEFSLTAPANSGLMEKLPIGTFISHSDTTEIMMVENHEINDNKGEESDVIITGSGYETFLNNRIVGSNKAFPVSGVVADYPLSANYSWNQAVTLINNHVLASALIDDNNAIPYLSIIASVSGTSYSVARTIPRGSLYESVLDLIAVDNLGLKIIRPGDWSPLGGSDPNVVLVIHKGVDRTASVVLSYDAGEIESADYLWSNKKLKNSVLITGKWVETILNFAGVEYARRTMYIDASDIDESFTTAPSGADLVAVVAAMHQRGQEAIMSQKDLVLSKAEVSREVFKYKYRTDYDVGDLITVKGNYNEATSMRVTEYVEIEDETGESGYPTLTKD